MEHGYIKLWRKIIYTSFFRNPNIFQLACYLLIESNHRDRKMLFNGNELIIKRGQCLVGRKALAASLGQTEQSVRTGLATLATIGFLTIKSTNKFTIVSIDKYEQYQGEINQDFNQQVTNKQPTTNQQVTTLKNDKNDKNIENTCIPQPATAGEVDGPVNWENCRTDLQRFIAFYVKDDSPELYATAKKSQATAIFKRHGRDASEILKIAGGLENALQAYLYGKKVLSGRGLSWNLTTIAKNATEFVNATLIQKRSNNVH